jgi:toxin FitB
MILLGHNVVSEAMKAEPQVAVLHWLNDQVAETLFLSSVTASELCFGVRALSDGQRRRRLEQALTGVMGLFADRIVPFDSVAARSCADLVVRARLAGRGFPTPDGYIAAIAAARGWVIASRDTAPFAAAGLHVIDPWRA